jgi:dipeptidyl aminopeptidase/acylaminoacyl peptidase
VLHQHRQDETFRTALAAAGVEVELVLLPGEGHFFTQMANQAEYLRRMLDWFNHHLRP